MKYKVLKNFQTNTLTWKNKWEIYENKRSYVNLRLWITIGNKELIDQGFIEEVKETPKPEKPKWKVGDYVVFDCNSWEKKYMRIFEIQSGKMYWYNKYYTESELRDPTESEKSLYFR